MEGMEPPRQCSLSGLHTFGEGMEQVWNFSGSDWHRPISVPHLLIADLLRLLIS